MIIVQSTNTKTTVAQMCWIGVLHNKHSLYNNLNYYRVKSSLETAN